MIVPTTAQLREIFIANYEAQLGQSVPLMAKAFIRVIASIEAMIYSTLLKYAGDRVLQSFATTATNSGLDAIGAVYGITRKTAVASELLITLPGVEDTLIPAGPWFVARLNGLLYTATANAYVIGGIAEITVRAAATGTMGNLDPGAEMAIVSPIAGMESTATVASTVTLGVEAEADSEYRRRILDRIRSIIGGGNAAQYRDWAQEVAGVARAYPYAGKPWNILTASVPPDRTVYVRAIASIEVDGIAPPELLTSVRTALILNPLRGGGRAPLGLTVDTLYVESIRRTGIYVTIVQLRSPAGQEATVQAALLDAVQTYLFNAEPFVEAVDSPIGRNDVITDVAISEIVQRTIRQYGATAQGVAFGLFEGDSLAEYILSPGELVKLMAVRYI